jgi:hypothetical protein
MRRVTVFFALLSVSMAVAAFCCDPWGLPVQAVFMQVGTSVAATLTASQSTVSTLLNTTLDAHYQTGVGQTLVEINKQTAQLKTMAGGMLATQQSMDAQSVVAGASEQFKAAAQQDTTVTNAALTQELDPIINGKVQSYDQAWSNSFLSTTFQTLGNTVIARHQPYCAPQDVTMSLCTQAAVPALQDADLMITSLYQPGQGLYETLSDQEHGAALAFIQNLTQPVPYAALPSSTPGQTPVTLDAMQIEAARQQAVLGLVAHSFNEQLAERTRRHE